MIRALLLLLCVAVVLHSTYSEYYPENAISCRDELTDKDEVACRKVLAGNLNCFQKDYCVTGGKGDMSQAEVIVPFNSHVMTIAKCSDQDGAKRIGMTCDGWPGYMGGYPMYSPLKWDDEWEKYTCLQNNTLCTEWESYEDSPTEYEIGTYTCQSTAVSTNGIMYCESFTSVQVETKKCGDSAVCELTVFSLNSLDNTINYLPLYAGLYSMAARLIAINQLIAWRRAMMMIMIPIIAIIPLRVKVSIQWRPYRV